MESPPIMPTTLGAKPTEQPSIPKPAIRRVQVTQPDGTVVESELHHNPVEL